MARQQQGGGGGGTGEEVEGGAGGLCRAGQGGGGWEHCVGGVRVRCDAGVDGCRRQSRLGRRRERIRRAGVVICGGVAEWRNGGELRGSPSTAGMEGVLLTVQCRKGRKGMAWCVEM